MILLDRVFLVLLMTPLITVSTLRPTSSILLFVIVVLKLKTTPYSRASFILSMTTRFLLLISPLFATSLFIDALIFDRDTLEFLNCWMNVDLLMFKGSKYCSNSSRFLERFVFFTLCISVLISLRSTFRLVLLTLTCLMNVFFLFCGRVLFWLM